MFKTVLIKKKYLQSDNLSVSEKKSDRTKDHI